MVERPLIIGSTIAVGVLLAYMLVLGIDFNEKEDLMHELGRPLTIKEYKTAILFNEKQTQCAIYPEYRLCRFIFGYNLTTAKEITPTKLILKPIGFNIDEFSYYILSNKFEIKDEDDNIHVIGVFKPLKDTKFKANQIYLAEFKTEQWASGEISLEMESSDTILDKVEWKWNR